MSRRPRARRADNKGRRPTRGRGSAFTSSRSGRDSSQAWVSAGALVDIDFVNDRAFQSGTLTASSVPLTIARASSGFVDDTTGLWTSVGSNLLRRSNKGVLIEEARTNNLLQCRDMTNAAWVKGATMTVAQNQTGIDGTANSATLVTGGAVSGTNTVLQTITLGSATDTYSVWLKRVSGSGTINITGNGGTVWTPAAVTTTWTKFAVTATLVNPVCGIQIITDTDSVAVDFNQLEGGAFSTSPILTTTVAVTRAADNINLTSVTGVTLARGSIYAEWQHAVLPAGASALAAELIADANNLILMGKATTEQGVTQVVSAASTVATLVTTATIAAGTLVKAASAYALNDFVMVDNLEATVLTDVSGAVPTGTPAMWFGSNAGATLWLDGYLRRVTYFPARLSNAALQGLLA